MGEMVVGYDGSDCAKAALLSGPDAGRAWLRHGGVLVFDDGGFAIVPSRLGVLGCPNNGPDRAALHVRRRALERLRR